MTAPSAPLPISPYGRTAGAIVNVCPSCTPGLLAVSFEGPAVTGMLARYAGTLTLCDLDIVWASITPLPSAAVRHEFEVLPLGTTDGEAIQHDLSRLVRQAEDGAVDIGSRLRMARRRKPAPTAEPVEVAVDLDSGITTGVRIRAADRPGLLHDIALAISSFGYRTRSITVLTSGGVARDTFRIVDVAGHAPRDSAKLESLRMRLAIACQ